MACVAAGEEATNAFKEAAALFGKLREPSEELQMLREAATSLTHKDAKEAARMLEEVLVPRLVDAGKLDEVGRMHLQIAESLDGEDVDAAMEHYRQAMNMFTSAGAASEALKCKLKLGQELGRQEMYDEAVDMFVQVRGSARFCCAGVKWRTRASPQSRTGDAHARRGRLGRPCHACPRRLWPPAESPLV